MNMLTLDQQSLVRLTAFFGIFLLMGVWEVVAPRRALRVSKRSRWFVNLSITFLNSLVGRYLLPVTATGLALSAQAQGWGIMNYFGVPSLLAGVISIVILDAAIYAQHFFFHKIRFFWYFHGMHHTDLDIDVTTGARFHPAEIAISLVIKMGLIILVGIPAWSFLLFEILLNGTSMFNHSNVRVNAKIDRFLRLILVTPDMHRVHHSVIIKEHDSNFGFNLPWWDRIFGTYKSQPTAGHDSMVIGLANFRDPRGLTLPRLLTLPFVKGRKL
jgi:sterol desaturase/sphingolipid hydroxylase (fatty acid hydroxylase superfamily)